MEYYGLDLTKLYSDTYGPNNDMTKSKDSNILLGSITDPNRADTDGD